ncbi:MAG TPA: hypothetical protein PKC24_04675 [Cyclobacteriaceae bacterium]|nr:hypothetical protein [Cyclobacteriaceae bacterium]
MKNIKPTLSDSDMVTIDQDFSERVSSTARKGLSTVAIALALTGPAVGGLSACSDAYDVTTIADRAADSRDVGRYDTGSFSDPFDFGRYDTSDRDVTRTAD